MTSARKAMSTRPPRGFSLVELMVAVAVVAILSAIAIPSYSAYVIRGQRAAAKAVLLQTAQAMERYYTQNGSYVTTAGLFPLNPVGGTATCVALAPMDSNTTTYCISGAATASRGYVLSATPCGAGGCPAAANQGYQDAACNVLTIDNTGLKAVVGATSTADQCWQH
jgi:type IV pilus assembly protein PilE